MMVDSSDLRTDEWRGWNEHLGVTFKRKDKTHYGVFTVAAKTKPDAEKAAGEALKRKNLNTKDYIITVLR